MNHWMKGVGLVVSVSISAAAFAQNRPMPETRIKDLVNFQGVRVNALIGFGVVVGLKGTGDSKKFLSTNTAVANMLTKLGQKTDAKDITSQSVAAVIATADLPPFARSGDRVDIRVSTVGDAQSLAGGTLLLTQLRAGDGQVYVVAQGGVAVGQADGSGPRVLTVARVPGGGAVERESNHAIVVDGKLLISLREPDFTTNARIAERINSHLKGYFAQSLDPASISIEVPELFRERLVEFVAEIETLAVPVDRRAVVAINERTGTIVMGDDAVLEPVAIAHGDLTIKVSSPHGESKDAGGQSEGSVAAVGGSTVGDLVKSLNQLGVKPADLVGILQALHAAGALHADLRLL